MSILEYASKFMELSRFAPTFVADERFKMNRFEAGLNPTIKEKMSVHQYTSYVDLYDNAVYVERAMKERSNYLNEQRGLKRKGDQTSNLKNRIRGLIGTITPTTMHVEASTPTLGLS